MIYIGDIMLKAPLQDLKVEGELLNGFFRAIVEDRNDPLKAGRVRVRIHGLHSPSTIKTNVDGIPTNELPFAEPVFPANYSSMSGFGQWSVPLQGSQVMVFFENGNPMRPMYFASVPGIPESKESYSNNNKENKKTDGFKDPNGKYPLSSRLGEPDVHRLARGISTDTIIEDRNNNRETGVPIAGGGTWNEPESSYNSQYPHNYVIATHGGIVIELDSTENSKRINIHHPSNSFIEIDNDGNMIIKNTKEKYELVTEGKNIYIKQQRNLTINGNSNKKVGGNETTEINGNLNITIDGNATLTASLVTINSDINVNGSITTTGDVTANGISLETHTHGGVQTGSGNTGQPN